MSANVSILIVDDEPALLKLMQAYLERLGYRVRGFMKAADALQEVQSNPGAYSLVVADLNLPDQPGDAMALEMVRVDETLKVLLCSGYPFEVESLPGAVRKRFAALQKPFVPNMLAKELEALLNRT